MNPEVGTTIKEYVLTQYLGDGGWDVMYLGQHVTLEVVVLVRILKPERCVNASMRKAYVSRLHREMRELELREGEDYWVQDSGEECAFIRNAEGLDFAELQPQSPGPDDGMIASYHDEVQLLAMVSLPASLALGSFLLFLARYLFLWDFSAESVLVGMVGMVFFAAGAGAVGMLNRRKWGYHAAGASQIFLLISLPILITIFVHVPVAGGTISNLQAVKYLAIGGWIVPMVALFKSIGMLFSRCASHYFR